LANALSQEASSSKLQTLDLRHNDEILGGETTLKALGQLFKSNASLLRVWFLETTSDATVLTVAGLHALAQGLVHNTTLISLKEDSAVEYPKMLHRKNKAIKRELERLELLLQFNREQNYSAKATFCQDLTMSSSTPSSTANTTEDGSNKNAGSTVSTACSACHRSSSGNNNYYFSCSMKHFICVPCMEIHFTEHLGTLFVSCPGGCESRFSVREDLYGHVSVQCYEAHCQQLFLAANTAKEELSPALAEASSLLEDSEGGVGEIDISDLLDE